MTANQGSLYLCNNGVEDSTYYVKTTGISNTGWKGIKSVTSGITAQRPITVPTGFSILMQI
ncbi:hypothetical protein COM81_03505 [Priestia megaterium]|uniref:hypothetical protein n=1 Tax=Priestia megaterium TaxID=1404 RepID=UPI000BEC3C30|nr:hypothetical protein [Priestia megaterium]PEE78063.1 hypothetical protein COM81_03505 [Priestia megaterium]